MCARHQGTPCTSFFFFSFLPCPGFLPFRISQSWGLSLSSVSDSQWRERVANETYRGCLVRLLSPEKLTSILHMGQEDPGGFISSTSFHLPAAAVWWALRWALRQDRRESALWSDWRCQLGNAKGKSLPSRPRHWDRQMTSWALLKIRKWFWVI